MNDTPNLTPQYQVVSEPGKTGYESYLESKFQKNYYYPMSANVTSGLIALKERFGTQLGQPDQQKGASGQTSYYAAKKALPRKMTTVSMPTLDQSVERSLIRERIARALKLDPLVTLLNDVPLGIATSHDDAHSVPLISYQVTPRTVSVDEPIRLINLKINTNGITVKLKFPFNDYLQKAYEEFSIIRSCYLFGAENSLDMSKSNWDLFYAILEELVYKSLFYQKHPYNVVIDRSKFIQDLEVPSEQSVDYNKSIGHALPAYLIDRSLPLATMNRMAQLIDTTNLLSPEELANLQVSLPGVYLNLISHIEGFRYAADNSEMARTLAKAYVEHMRNNMIIVDVNTKDRFVPEAIGPVSTDMKLYYVNYVESKENRQIFLKVLAENRTAINYDLSDKIMFAVQNAPNNLRSKNNSEVYKAYQLTKKNS